MLSADLDCHAVHNPPHTSPGLAVLMSRVCLRDQAAFKQLYDATSHCLLGVIVRMLRDRSWAEEVLQEVYVSVWHTAPNYSATKSQPMTWLMAIARYKAMDALRSTRADREHCVRPQARADDDDDAAGLPDAPDPSDGSAGPLDQLLQASDSLQLRCCLQRLEPQQRQAIALAFYDGLTHAELALHMQQPLGTVKAWVRRGLDRLKRCLEPEAVGVTP
jgi:RNA polymerase sigma factor (sigma-70 family)